MTLILTAPPEVEPVTVEQVKFDASIDGCDFDEKIDSLITIARQTAESETGRALITQTWQLVEQCFSGPVISLDKAPVQSITSIKYRDASNVEQTLSSAYYSLDTLSGYAKVRLNYGYSWPSTHPRFDAVTIEFDAGYGDSADDVPEPIKLWIRLRAAAEADQAGDQVKISDFADRSLDPYRLYHV